MYLLVAAGPYASRIGHAPGSGRPRDRPGRSGGWRNAGCSWPWRSRDISADYLSDLGVWSAPRSWSPPSRTTRRPYPRSFEGRLNVGFLSNRNHVVELVVAVNAAAGDHVAESGHALDPERETGGALNRFAMGAAAVMGLAPALRFDGLIDHAPTPHNGS
jgi:hypothetical protein